MRKPSNAFQCEVLFIDHYFQEKLNTKSRNERLLFTLLETELKYKDICWEIVWGKWWSFPGKISCSLPHQLFPVTPLFLSASKEQHS